MAFSPRCYLITSGWRSSRSSVEIAHNDFSKKKHDPLRSYNFLAKKKFTTEIGCRDACLLQCKSGKMVCEEEETEGNYENVFVGQFIQSVIESMVQTDAQFGCFVCFFFGSIPLYKLLLEPKTANQSVALNLRLNFVSRFHFCHWPASPTPILGRIHSMYFQYKEVRYTLSQL